MTEPNHLLGAVLWKFLFGDKVKSIPDPNKPENMPHIAALKKAEVEKLKLFMEGSGKTLFDFFQSDVRERMFNLMIKDPSGCTCAISWELHDLQNTAKIMAKIISIVEEQKQNK